MNAPFIGLLEQGTKVCDHCGQSFRPRSGSGGKPQRFCSTECRTNFHAQRSQRRPTCSVRPAHIGPAPQGSPENAPKNASEDFDWIDREIVVLSQQPKTAVYWNRNGDLVIRQRAFWPDEDGHRVIIARSLLDTFIDKITDFAVSSGGSGEQTSKG